MGQHKCQINSFTAPRNSEITDKVKGETQHRSNTHSRDSSPDSQGTQAAPLQASDSQIPCLHSARADNRDHLSLGCLPELLNSIPHTPGCSNPRVSPGAHPEAAMPKQEAGGSIQDGIAPSAAALLPPHPCWTARNQPLACSGGLFLLSWICFPAFRWIWGHPRGGAGPSLGIHL